MPRDRNKITKDRPVEPDSVDAEWRIFVGIDFPDTHRTILDELLEIVSATELPIRWIAANAAHLTLHFIGEVPVETAELLRLGFAGAGGRTHPFSLAVDGAASA